MAGMKGRSGRKKKILKLKAAEPEKTTSPSLLDQVGAVFQSQQTNPSESAPIPTASIDSNAAAFHRAAQDLTDKYPAAAVGGGPDSVPPGMAGGAAPEVIPPPKPFCTPEQCAKWLKFVFNGLENAHGPRWHMERDELEAYAESTAEMLNEQAPAWLAESPNKALYLWLMATALIIGSRSENGEKLISWFTEKISNFGKPSVAQAVRPA